MKGFGGVPGGMQNMLKEAQKLQKKIQDAQVEAESLVADGSAGGGMVTVKVNGKGHLLAISINKEVVNPDDIGMLQDLIIAATNQAISDVQKRKEELMGGVAGGLNLASLGIL